MKRIQLAKSLATVLVAGSLATGMVTQVSADTYSSPIYTYNPGMCTVKYVGSSYTSDWLLAVKLDAVFNGNYPIFSNDSKTFPVGSKLNNDKKYKVNGKSGWTGWQCYIYGNAVYFHLTGDFVGNGANSYKNSKVVLKNKASASYELFRNSGVTCGSYLRTTGNSNGSFNGKDGHSLIILSYDQNQIITLEGNANGNGSIEIITRSWKDFNKKLLTKKGRRICHVVVPKNINYCPF